VGINWGYLYLAVPSSIGRAYSGSLPAARMLFSTTGYAGSSWSHTVANAGAEGWLHTTTRACRAP
jgi:hypothetical protein